MAINLSIFSGANAASKTVTFDFAGDILAGTSGFATTAEFYFKVTTSAKSVDGTTQGKSYPIVKTVKDLSTLALNGVKQSATNTAAPYADIHSMIVDYTHDYVYGHSANQFSSGVTYQGPIKFK